MANDTSRGDDENRKLQGSIDDLIRIQALSGIWSKLDASHIVSTSLDVLVSVLHLDFAYALLSDSVNGSVEMVRLARGEAPAPRPEEIGRTLAHWVTDHSATTPAAVPNPVGEGEIRIAPIRLGLLDEIGVLIAGSTRADFPTQTETLLLRVAANQALAALQEGRRANEQQRHAAGLIERDCAAREDQARVAKWRARRELLTPREREVMAHVVSGMLNKQIAAELGVVEKTVKFHRSHVMQKMQVASVAELVRLATRLEM